MSQYVTVQEVKDLGSMPAEDIDALETSYSDIVDRIATAVSGMFDARLIKRYAAPFEAPYPDALKMAVVQVVVYRLYRKRGYDPSSTMGDLIQKDHDDALAWLKEAADSKEGLVELPIRQATPPEATAVDSGGPLGYSEASPYAWMDVQATEVYGS
jgi:phage gp36-like protein